MTGKTPRAGDSAGESEDPHTGAALHLGCEESTLPLAAHEEPGVPGTAGAVIEKSWPSAL